MPASRKRKAHLFSLRGAERRLSTPSALETREVALTLKAHFTPAARGGASHTTTSVQPDNLIEVEFAGGERMWTRADDFHRQHVAPLTRAGAARKNVFDVPSALSFASSGLEVRNTRGVASWVIKSLKVFEVSLPRVAANTIAARVEQRTTADGKKPGLGLFRCSIEKGRFALTSATRVAADEKPWLLFIHGTGSTTWGSFGELWADARRHQLDALRSTYEERVLAFEHRTLTHSPIENALDLIRALNKVLPRPTPLHLVTHSRGGLVGELLCRAHLVSEGFQSPDAPPKRRPPPFSSEELALFSGRRGRSSRSRSAQITLIEQLGRELAKAPFTIERFVRVACPALGTTLASGRLDRWLSVIGTLAALMPSPPLIDTFNELGDFVAAVIKERTDPSSLPGLEAMMLDSPFIKLVNWPTVTVDGDLAVIAGDIEPDAWWARLAIWVGDRFYEGDHDLVVNTPSMFGGARRAGGEVVSLHKAQEVNHFTYFIEPASVDRLITALTVASDRVLDGFEPLHRPHVDIARAAPPEEPGADSRKRVRRRTAEPQLHVRVVHGNLAFASHSVAVGHYEGDTIASAEKHLDRALQFALSRRLHLGLYAGPIETNAVFTNPLRATDRNARPEGAIVVGLGAVGSLTASSLTRSFARALLEYVVEWRKGRPLESGGTAPAVNVSALLIGTGAGGISVSDSVFALLRGVVRANEALAAAQERERITMLEFVEIYQDRALKALDALQRLLTRRLTLGSFELDLELGSRGGGLQRVMYDEEPNWWQRLQILGGERPGETNDGALRFAAMTSRARTEVRLHATQRAIVDQFVEDATVTTHDDRNVARTLFELLLPNELKENAPDEDNLVLLLDEAAAQYPWELVEDPSDRRHQPLVIERGLLRQLEAREFRESVQPTLEKTALVIGDPISPFVELKGAQDEAETVSRALRRGYTPVKAIRPTSQEVLTALFARPYKVLHLAGHGVYRYIPDQPTARGGSPQTVTGMVIGDGVFLTPGEIRQLRQVPDLVFVNCCYLGRVESGMAGATPQERAFPKLAANLATEFIRMGVRAVVAAGWAVEDAAASAFAKTFYDEMMRGEPFGDAVKTARAVTYQRHPRSNTWGAYQCYGDPDFRLIFSREGLAKASEPRLLSPAHAFQELSNVVARLKTESSMGRETERQYLRKTLTVIEKRQWLHHGALSAALGRAFAEAGQLEQAVGYFCAALASEDGAVTVNDLEYWAKLVGSFAIEVARDTPDVTRVQARAIRGLAKTLVEFRGKILEAQKVSKVSARRPTPTAAGRARSRRK